MLVDAIALAQDGEALDDRVRADDAARADDDLVLDDSVRPDANVRRDDCAGTDDCGGMNPCDDFQRTTDPFAKFPPTHFTASSFVGTRFFLGLRRFGLVLGLLR